MPEVHWDYTLRNVFVMERIHGIPVTDVAALKAAGVDLKQLAERGVKIFFTQVFRDSFFHADMHPGNIFVEATDPARPALHRHRLRDHGQPQRLRPVLPRAQPARDLPAADYREVAELHVECGWVPPQTRVQDFESAMRAICEPVFEKPMGQISFGQLLVYLFQTARRFDMEVQPSLVLLQKTLLNIEGLGRQLYPELNLWANAKPFLEQWVSDRYSPRGLLEKLQKRAPGWLEQLPQRPEKILEALRPVEAPRAPAAQAATSAAASRGGGERWRLLELLVAAGGMVLVNPHAAALPMTQWHPATWIFAALAVHALFARHD